MEHYLSRVVDWDFLIDLKVHCREVLRISIIIEGVINTGHVTNRVSVLVTSWFVMYTHDYLMSMDIYMPLHERHWLV
jgi:hypothetical protein